MKKLEEKKKEKHTITKVDSFRQRSWQFERHSFSVSGRVGRPRDKTFVGVLLESLETLPVGALLKTIESLFV